MWINYNYSPKEEISEKGIFFDLWNANLNVLGKIDLMRYFRFMQSGDAIIVNFADKLMSRESLTPLGREVIRIVKQAAVNQSSQILKGYFEKNIFLIRKNLSLHKNFYLFLWMCISIVEMEGSWQSPSNDYSLLASRGYNDVGGTYWRYTLAGGKEINFPQYGELRLFFKGDAAFISAIKAVFSSYFLKGINVRLFINKKYARNIQRFVHQLKNRFSWEILYYSTSKELANVISRISNNQKSKDEVIGLITNDFRDFKNLDPILLKKIPHIISSGSIDSEQDLLENESRIYLGPEIYGESLAIIVPQRECYPAFVLQQQRGGFISDWSLKSFTFLYDPEVSRLLKHSKQEKPIFTENEDDEVIEEGEVKEYLTQFREYYKELLIKLEGMKECMQKERGRDSYLIRIEKSLTEAINAHIKNGMGYKIDSEDIKYLRFLKERENLIHGYRATILYLALLKYLKFCSGNGRFYLQSISKLEKRQSLFLGLNKIAKKRDSIFTDTFIFNCAMAAYAALVDYFLLVFMRDKEYMDHPIVFGSSAYPENEWLIQYAFKKKDIIRINGNQVEELLNIVKGREPFALFFEIITNSVNLIRTPIDVIIEGLRKEPPKHPIFIVMDITAAGNKVNFKEILKEGLPRNVTLFIVESFQKFYQRGMEMTSGGSLSFVVSSKKELNKLRKCLENVRMMNKTRLEPFNAFRMESMQPSLNELYEKVDIHTRNTERLANYIKELNHPYIGRVSIPSQCTENIATCAPYFWIEPYINTFKRARLLLYSIISCAQKYGVNVQDRDSFYFNVPVLHISRAYYQGLRVSSSGIEDACEMARLKRAFKAALDMAYEITKNDQLYEIEKHDDEHLKGIVQKFRI